MSSDYRVELNMTELEIIAERILRATIDDKSFDVFVRFGKPALHPKGDWACPYQITGIGDEKLHYAVGIDSVQSLQLAMFAVDADLSVFRKEVKLTFLDENHLGFPSTTREATGSCPYCRSGETE